MLRPVILTFVINKKKCHAVDEIRRLGKDPVGISRAQDNEPLDLLTF